MSAFFNFQSLLIVVLLVICTCSYIRAIFPNMVNSNKEGFLGFLRRAAVIGDRLSPWVSASCVIMAVSILFVR